MSLKKYFRKRVYRWHRLTSLIIALPVLMWSLSGFLHPVMNSFKPEVRNQSLPVSAIDTSHIRVSLQQAMEKNKITSLYNFRIIKLDSSYYYQIQHADKDSLTYLSCSDGKQLKDGDKLYAAYLAQRYLSEPVKKEKQNAPHGHQLAADIGLVAMNFVSQKNYAKSRVRSVELVTEFNREYKSSNVLLPVYKVSFDRGDNIRLYIETSTDRMATAVDDKRAWFVKFFAATHSWSFLDGMGNTKQIILGVFSFLCFLSSVLGFYVYNITGKKSASTAGKTWHRLLGNVFVLTTALYGVSGAWHAVQKLSEKAPTVIALKGNNFSTEELTLAPAQLLKNLHHTGSVSGISVIRMYKENYWQLTVVDGKHKYKKYIHTRTGKELMHGDVAYARYLACGYSGNTLDAITGSAIITKFTNSYSMKYKRLPVMEVRFSESDNYYIETNTGQLAAITTPYDKAERFSFSNLHMHHYWEHWFGEKGKSIQKTVLLTSTFGLLLLAMTGIFIYMRRRAKR